MGKRRKGAARELDAVRLAVFHELFAALAEEMGESLRETAPSVNIRERRDYSCAVFDAEGELVAQAAHIPVHLGSAGLSVAAVRERYGVLDDGDAVLLNDPYRGGTHLPDLTLVTALSMQGRAPWYVVSRAHHSDVGGSQPGSMAPAADLPAEGLRIPPVRLLEQGKRVGEIFDLVLANTRTPRLREGDLRAQVESNRIGAARLRDLWERYGLETCAHAGRALRAYSSRLLATSIAKLAVGRYEAHDVLEGDGEVDDELDLHLELRVARDHRLVFDFCASGDSSRGGMNANPAIVHAAVLYALRCAHAADLPVNGGLMRDVEIRTRKGSLVDPVFPAAVAGGNVETSQRLVDLCLEALALAGAKHMPAQSSGTMNNLCLGGVDRHGEGFALYETIAGGAGANDEGPGCSGVQTHMTNTRNTPIEETELVLPLVIESYTLRRASGGRGVHRGGDGLRKELRALVPMQGSLLAERRVRAPRGRAGGHDGLVGRQSLRPGGRLPSKGVFRVDAGQVLRIETPAGGGWGAPS